MLLKQVLTSCLMGSGLGVLGAREARSYSLQAAAPSRLRLQSPAPTPLALCSRCC